MKSKLILFVVIFLHAAFLLHSQERPRIIVPTGHSGAIAAMAIDKEESTLYTLGLDGALKTWDINSGLERGHLKLFDGNYKQISKGFLDISPDGKYAAAATSWNSQASIIDLEKMKVVANFTDWNTGMAGLQFLVDNTICVTGMSGIGLISLDGKKIRKLQSISSDEIIKGAAYPHAAVLSPDRTLLAVSFTSNKPGTSTVRIFNVPEGRQLYSLPMKVPYPEDFSFSSDNKTLLLPANQHLEKISLRDGSIKSSGFLPADFAAYCDSDSKIFICNTEGQMSLLNAADLSVISTDYQVSNQLNFKTKVSAILITSHNGSLFRNVTFFDNDQINYGNVQLYALPEFHSLREFTGLTAVTYSAGFNPAANKLVTGSGDGFARIWDLQQGGVERQFSNTDQRANYLTKLHFRKAMYARGGEWVGFSNELGTTLIDTIFESSMSLGYNEGMLELSPDGKHMVTAGVNGLNIWAAPTDSFYEAKLVKSIPLREQPTDFKFISGSRLLVSYRNEAVLYHFLSGTRINSFDFPGNRVDASAELPDSNFLVIAGGFTSGVFTVVDATTGKPVFKREQHERPISSLAIAKRSQKMVTASEDNVARIWDVSNPMSPAVDFVLRGHTDVINSCSFSADERMIVTTSEDNTTKIWSTDTGEELCTLIGIGNDWIMITPEGYYFASRNGARALHFVANDRTYNFDQYDLVYNRPDLVLARIGLAPKPTIDAYRRAYEKRISKSGMDTSLLNATFGLDAPQVSINTGAKPLLSTDKSTVTINVTVKDASTALDRIYIRVNGVPLKSRRGTVIPGNNKTYQSSISIPLGTGKNLVEVNAVNKKGVESMTQSFVINSNAPATSNTLYLLTIGVSRYANDTLNLRYPAKDVQDLTAQFSKSNKYFGKVVSMQLVDSQVTVKNVRNLKKIISASQPDDYVILFYAGHGFLGKNYDYYLSSYEVDRYQPEKEGILFDEIESLLDNIGARRKILLVDACNSGEYDGDGNTIELPVNQELVFRSGKPGSGVARTAQGSSLELMKELFVDLRRSSGVTAISSSSAVEYSLESDAWKNGAFTYCLLDGIRSMSADVNNDRIITVTELLKHVQKQVMLLTGNRQRPTTRAENVVVDYRIW